MEVPLSISVEDSGEEWVVSLPDGTEDVQLQQKIIEDETGAGPPGTQVFTQESEELSRIEVRSKEPDQEEMVVEMEGISSRLERDDMMREAEKSKAVHKKEKFKIYTESHTAVIQAVKEARKEKGSEVGDGVQKITEGAEMTEKSDKETKRLHAFMSSGGDKEVTMKRICDEDNDLAVKEGGIQSKVDARQAGNQNKVGNCSGRLDEEKKRDKKAKKSKSSSERIQKKLEKIDAKISRILAKKGEYEGRLKEAQERERQESEKAASFQEREVLTAVMGKPASDRTNPDLITDEIIAANRLRLEHDASTMESEKGFSGSLSRTASLIEVTSAELMEEVAVQKTVAENLAKLLVSDGSEMNIP